VVPLFFLSPPPLWVDTSTSPCGIERELITGTEPVPNIHSPQDGEVCTPFPQVIFSASTYNDTHIHMNTHTHTRTHKHTYTNTHTHTHTGTQRERETHTHTQCIYVCVHIYKNTCTSVYIRSQCSRQETFCYLTRESSIRLLMIALIIALAEMMLYLHLELSRFFLH